MKRLFLLSLLLLMVLSAWADVYPIGTLGTSSAATYGPISGWYDFGWTKTIVTAAEMNAAGYDGTDNIVGLGYYVGNTPANYQIIDVHCFVRHTALGTYTTTADETGTAMPDSTAFTQVFSGTLNFNGGGWHYFAFNLANFNWDGTSNIEVFWKNWDGDYVTGYPTYRYASTSPDYRVVYKQQDTTWPTTAGTRSNSRSNISIVTPSADPPNPAILGYPTDAGYAFLDATLSWSDGGGMPTSYDVYLGTVNPPTTLVADDITTTSYTPTLTPGTTYYWKVVPSNANGPATGVSTWSFKTPTANQIAESFDATDFPPLGWTTPDGAFTRSTSTPYYGAASAYESIAAGPSYLYTPMLELTSTSELNWWMRTSATTGIGRVQIVYSEDGTTWNNIGDEIVMPTETTWMNYNVDLSSLAGNNYMIGFKVYSSTSTSTYFYIDHVVGPELAALVPEPAMLVYPADAGYAFLDASLSWNAAGSGGIPTSYDVYFGTTNPPDYVTNQAELTYTPTLAAATTYYWQIVPRNDTGSAENCPVWSFSTPGATQLAESFDDTSFPPLGWLRTTTSTSYWGRSTTSPFYGAASMYASTSTSTPYTISTPVLAIDATSGLDFYAKASATTQVLQVLQSTDRTTWTQVGADITFAATGIWYPVSIDLSGLTPGNYYLAFHSPTQTAASYIYVDHLIGPELAAVAPGPVTLSAPADAAIDQTQFPTFTWTAPTLGGLPTGYKVYCDMNTDPTTEIGDVTGLSFTATTALTYSNVYYWKVVAYNASGNSTGNTVRSFTVMADPTIYTMPWLEDFGTTGTTFPPTNWSRWSGALADPSTLTSGSTVWGQDNWLNDTTVTPVNYSARMNIYGTARQHWIITPPIQMPGAGYQLEFDIALTDYNNAALPDDPAGYSGVDDRFAVLISDGSTWSQANAIKLWDNDAATTGGIYEVYNDVPHTGIHYTIPLDAYTGVKYIAFYGESTVSNADNDFFVDNVRIRLAGQAPDHVTLLTPEDQSTSVDPGNCILNWQNAVGGGEPGWYEIYVGTDLIDPANEYYGEYMYETTTSTLDLSAQVDIDLGFNTTWYWAVLPFNEYGNPDPATGLQVFRFTTLPDPTIVALPHEEYFDSVTAPALPYGWTRYVNTVYTGTTEVLGTYSSTTYAQSAPNSVRLYNYTDAAADLRLITPMIDASIPLNTIKLKFYARSGSAGYPLLIGTVNTPDGTGTFTMIDSLALTTTKTEYIYSLDAYAGTDQYICFKHGLGATSRTIYVDNVQLLELLPVDLAASSISGPGLLSAGTSYDFTISVFNEGTATQNSYTVNLMSMDTRTLLATMNVSTPLDPAATALHTLSWTPTLGGNYQIYGQVVAAGDGNTANDNSPLKEVNILDATMTLIAVGDDATTTSGYYVPISMFFKNGVTEELYFPDEMHLQSGTITAVAYKNTFVTNLMDKPIKIWMAHTTVTDLSAGWLPAIDYTLVFDGVVDFPSGVNYIVIPLDTPFAYTGGTLATRFYRPMDTAYFSSSDKFYYTTNPAHTIRSRYLHSDSDTYDPLAPSAAGTTLGYFPNTNFVVQNAVMQTGAILSGHVYESNGTTPIEGASVTLTDERYSTTTNADGFYEFTFWEDHTVGAVASKFGYYSQSVTGLAITIGNTVTQNFILGAMPRVNVTGYVSANDAAFLGGATVALSGIENHEVLSSAVDGSFLIPGVLGSDAGLAYTVTINKEGYQGYSATVTVFTNNMDIGTITLIEYLWTGYNLEATHEGSNARLNWEAAGEPDYLFFDFEADNGGWVGSGYGDWEYTDTYTLTGYTDNDTSVGTPPTAAHSGDGLWGTKVLGDYSNSSAWSYLRKTVDLAGFTSPVLSIWHYMNGYNTYDYGIIKVNGTTVWGSSAAAVFMPWQQLTVPLTAFEGMSTVEISFEWYATSVVSYAGWYIDDIYIGPATTRNVATLGTRNNDRAFLNYSVYRAPLANPENLTLLSGAVSDLTYLDTAFGSLPAGKYLWALKANYTGAHQSEAILSNHLGIVAMPQDIAATTVGATVQLSWTADPGADYYVIYASDDPYGTFTVDGYSATTTYNVAVPAAKKFYKVAAADGEMPAAPPAKLMMK